MWCAVLCCVILGNQVHRLNITVEILVNAAGVCRTGRVEALQSEDLETQLNLNVIGTSLLTRLFAKGKAKASTAQTVLTVCTSVVCTLAFI